MMYMHPKDLEHLKLHNPPQLGCDQCWRAWGVSDTLRDALRGPGKKRDADDATLKAKAP